MAIIRGTTGNDDQIQGTANDDVLFGFGGRDNFNGGDGSDLFVVGDGGSDTIDGGVDNGAADADQVVLNGAFASYKFSFDNAGHVFATIGDVVEQMTRVESISFDDKVVLVVGANSAYTTLQAAIDAASDGDTILIASGSFSGDVNVNKSVTILGANAGVEGDATGRSAESILTGSLYVTAAGVTIDGVKITGQGNGHGFAFYDGVAVAADNLTVVNSVFEGGPPPGGATSVAFETSQVTGLEIAHNVFSGYDEGIYVSGGGSSGTIHDNLFQGVDGATASGLGNGVISETTGVTIDDNVFDSLYSGSIFTVPFGDANVDLNEFIGDGNRFTNTVERPIQFIPVDAGTLSVTGTDFNEAFRMDEGSLTAGVTVDAAGGNDAVYGSNFDDVLTGGAGNDRIDGNGGGDVANFAGTLAGHSVTFAGGQVTVTDTNTADGDTGTDIVSGVERFAFADQTVLFVGADGPFETIQDAVNASKDGDVILVQSGDYAEQVVVDGKSNLTIRAMDGATVNIVAPSTLHETVVSSQGRDLNSIVTVTNSTNVTFDNINVDGDGRGGATTEGTGSGQADFVGITYRNASGDLVNVDITGVRDELLNGAQRGQAIRVDNDSLMHFGMSGGSISDFQKNGAIFNFADLEVHGVTVTGAGATNIIAQNGFQVTNSTGSLHDNIVQDFGFIGGNSASLILLYSNANLDVIGNTLTGATDPSSTSEGIVSIVISGLSNGVPNSGGEITGNILSYLDIGIEIGNGLTSNPIYIHGNTFTNLDTSETGNYGVLFSPDPTTTAAFVIEGSATYGDYLSGGAGNDLFTGLGGNDTLIGNGGNDTLDGGTGNDQLMGGVGNDTYIVDSAMDVIFEANGAGTDTVRTGLASYTLGANLENLTYTGTGNFTGVGNNFDNDITGGNGNDTLSGGLGVDTLRGGEGADTLTGDAGADKLIGGGGNDTYNIDAQDIITELANGGIDRVRAGFSVDLSAAKYVNIENASLTGNGAFNLVGNTGNNALVGNVGDNTITGGLGADVLTGAAGSDRFAYSSTSESGTTNSTADLIRDFVEALSPPAAGATDLIDVLRVDAKVHSVGNNAFAYIGSSAFHETGPNAVEGEIRSFTLNGNTVIEFNTDNSHAGAEMQIVLLGVHNLIDADFIL